MAFAISATTAAVLGASAIAGGAAIIGSSKAAKAQTQASNQATALQREQNAMAQNQFDTTRNDLAPYREAGNIALGQLTRGTADGAEFNRNFTMNDLTMDPGYAFRQQEGMKALEASAAARGGLLSGGTVRAANRDNQERASQEFGNAYNRYTNDLNTRYSRLAGIAGVGQGATNDTAQFGQQNVANQQQGTNNITNNINAAGNARASQFAAGANAIGGAANSVGQYFQLNSLLGGGNAAGGFNPGAVMAQNTAGINGFLAGRG